MASKPKLSEHDWIEYEVVTGWSAVQQVLSRLALEQCGGAPLTCGSVSSSAAHVLYTYRCAFCAKQGCKWQARVRIPRERAMLAVKPEQRSLVHAEHKCIVELAADTHHTNHFAPQGTGKKMANKCKRYNERERRKVVQDRVGCDVDLDTVGGLRALACTYSFERLSRSPTFSHDTVFLCPGWYINEDDVCLIFTTFNLLLNIHRANQYFGDKGLAYGLDHTFKVR